MQRPSYLKGMHLREASSGFPFAFKEEQSCSGMLYCTLGRQGVQRLRSLGPEEGSAQAVLCKSGFIDSAFSSSKERQQRRLITPSHVRSTHHPKEGWRESSWGLGELAPAGRPGACVRVSPHRKDEISWMEGL